MANLVEAHDDAIEADLRRRESGLSLRDEGERLSGDFYEYVREAWHVYKPDIPFLDNWHIRVICRKLEQVSRGEVRRLLLWLPPGAMKTSIVTIFWPTWEWTNEPWLQYLCASYHDDVATKDMAVPARDLIGSEWYQQRWGHVFALRGEINLQRLYVNTRGGRRVSTSPNPRRAVTGRHFDRIVIDDPVNASVQDATNEIVLNGVINWHDGTLATRWANPNAGAEVIVQQRLHERDLSGHVIDSQGAEEWEVLCLPYRYESDHEFVSPDDVRTEEGELLWPERLSESYEKELLSRLGGHRAAGQLQQRPSAREGEILKRASWRYFSPDDLAAAEEGDVSGLPAFRLIIVSWDTAFKELTSSDPVAGGVWGIDGPDAYLLRIFHERASLSRTKTEMLALREWAIARWPRAGVRTLIENKSNGPDIIRQLRKAIPGVTKYDPGSLDKVARAEAAEPDFDSGNVFICGAPQRPLDELGRGPDYDPAYTPAWAQEVIDQCAALPNGRHDDLVDMTTQTINWKRSRTGQGAKMWSPADVRLPEIAGVPTGRGIRVSS
jgi:phage terminase large subunit-like protein